MHADGLCAKDAGGAERIVPMLDHQRAREDDPPAEFIKLASEILQLGIVEWKKMFGVKFDAACADGAGDGDVIGEGDGNGVGARGSATLQAQGVSEAVGI